MNDQPLISADIGRIYTHGTTARVILCALNPADDCEFDVFIKPEVSAGRGPGIWVDSRHLFPTPDRVA